jgi:hypothetical protein
MRYLTHEVVLRDINSFHGAEYNPRKMISERLEQVKISLLKLGFVLPIYVNKNNVILSGHQRTTAAKAAGYTRVPVVELDVGDDQEKGLNVIFNKGTNDMDTYAGDARNAFVDYLEKCQNLLVGLPDIPPDTVYPCMQYKQLGLAEALKMIGKDVNTNLRGAGWSLLEAGIGMPVVVTESGRVVNGIGRIYGYSTKNYDQLDAVVIPDSMGDYAYMALNFLAMDFNIQKNFEDELRYNAFRRKSVQNQIVGLSRTYPYFVYNRIISNTAQKYALLEGQTNPDLMLLPQATETARKKFEDTYGKTIYDMGAGTLWDSQTMRKAGFDCVPFEPFYSPPGTSGVDPEASRQLIAQWLDHFEAHPNGPDSIISSFVLNSVPHHKDRIAYLTILAALSRISTRVYIGTQSVRTLNDNISSHLRLNADEPNVTLGNDTRFFKAQKFYYTEELERMLKVFWAKVEIKQVESNLFAKCSFPRRPKASLLGEALDLEFNMPYRDGTRLGLHTRARTAFSKYLGMPELVATPVSTTIE